MSKKTMEMIDSTGKVYGYAVWCPGCGHMHAFRTVPDGARPCWTFNGDVEKPTFHPSMLTWTPMRDGSKSNICHSFVRDGCIEFLGDCTAHQLRGIHQLPDADS